MASRGTSRSDRATQARLGPCTSVNTHDEHEDDVEHRWLCGHALDTGNVASTMGTRPRSPAQDRNTCSRHGSRNGQSEQTTDSGRATSSRTNPTTRAGSTWRQFARRDQQAEEHEQADLGEPAQALGERAGGGPVRQARRWPAPAPRGRRPGSRWRARRRPRRTPPCRARRWPAGTARRPAARAGAARRAEPADRQPERQADRELEDQLADQRPAAGETASALSSRTRMTSARR